MNNDFDKFTELHKKFARRALYGFYRHNQPTIKEAVEYVIGEAAPELIENMTFRQIFVVYQTLVTETLRWTECHEIQQQALADVQEYHATIMKDTEKE